jgi:hypothetical protein
MEYSDYVKRGSHGPAEMLRSGKVLVHSELIRMTNARRSEDEIAAYYGITRMGLWKRRKELDIPKNRLRSDKGVIRVFSSPENIDVN